MRDGETSPSCYRLIVENREKIKLATCLRGSGVLGKLREAQRRTVFCLIPREAAWAVGRHPGPRGPKENVTGARCRP